MARGQEFFPKRPRGTGGRGSDRDRRHSGASRGNTNRTEERAQTRRDMVAPESPFDANNPYNFVEWGGSQPLQVEDGLAATHDRWREKAPTRYSGVLDVTLTARSPIFVPAGNPAESRTPPRPQPFWSCADGEGNANRLGLPGASVKGAVRSLFEAWTNSRPGVLSEEAYQRPIPYRRRTATAWVIGNENPDRSLEVFACDEIEFVELDDQGTVVHQRGGARLPASFPRTDQTSVELDPVARPAAEANGWQAVIFRANLYGVSDLETSGWDATRRRWRKRHKHRWTHVAVRVGRQTAVISSATRTAYERNLEHLAFRMHWSRVQDLPKQPTGPRDMYTDVAHERVEADPRNLERGCRNRFDPLKDLSVGCLVFGLVDPGTSNQILCFGKNVNFLWPSKSSPKQLLCSYWPKQYQDLAHADWAEATFGFAAPHDKDRSSHPFRGRVRFETFWAQPNVTQPNPAPLKKLLAPTGVKLKARPLYLPPGERGFASSYDEAVALRGRKFYWHQGTRLENIPREHQEQGAEDLLIRPLPCDTEIKGSIHFDNLTEAELGALITCVCPSMYFNDGGQYAWKIGKGKPRALGSVEAERQSIRLRIRQQATATYRCLSAADLFEDREPDPFVDALRSKIDPGLDYVRDLRSLLLLRDRIRDYSAPTSYGWMPGFDNPTGDPGGRQQDGSWRDRNRVPAMKRAREIE